MEPDLGPYSAEGCSVVRSLKKYIEEIPTGLQPDRGEDRIDFWEDGENIIFQDGALQPAPGQYLLLPKPQASPVVGLLDSRSSDGKRNIFVGTLDSIHHWAEFAAVVDRTVAGDYSGVEEATATAPATLWSMVSWGDRVFATNYVDEIQTWVLGGAATFLGMSNGAWSDLPANYRASILGKIGPFLFAFRTAAGATINDFTIDWCDFDDPAVWTPAVTNAAGSLEVRDLGSPIVAAVPFADGYAVYGVNECRYLAPVPAPDYFGIRPLLSGIGALSKASVVSVERLQYGMGPRGIWAHDGSQVQYIDTPDVHDYIYSNINQAQASKCVAAFDSVENLVMFFWPSGGSIYLDLGVAFNRNNATWTKLSFARTASSPGYAFEGALTGSREGDVWAHPAIGFAPADTGAPLTFSPTLTLLTHAGYGHCGYGMGYYGSTVSMLEG